MQTFLPYPSFRRSMACLDPSRLGNQVYREALTLIRGGWPNHPASLMWRGYEQALALYGLAGLDELLRRGKDYHHHRAEFEAYLARADLVSIPMPPWLGCRAFHRSHRSNLVRKDPGWYRRFFPTVPADLPYVWPVQRVRA